MKDVRVEIEWNGGTTLTLTAIPGEEPGDLEVQLKGDEMPAPNAILMMCYGLYHIYNTGGKLTMDELMRYMRSTMESIEQNLLVMMDKGG